MISEFQAAQQIIRNDLVAEIHAIENLLRVVYIEPGEFYSDSEIAEWDSRQRAYWNTYKSAKMALAECEQVLKRHWDFEHPPKRTMPKVSLDKLNRLHDRLQRNQIIGA